MNEETKNKITDVKDLPIPKGVSNELAQWVKEPEVDKEIYQYKDLAEKIRNMPVVPKIPMCYGDLDELLDGGMQPGELMVVSGPTKNGKTSFCQNVSFKQALLDIPTLWLTLEMSWQEITRKFGEMYKGYRLPKDKDIDSLPIYYPVDTRGVGLEWVEEHIRNAKEKYGVKMVFIDHLHFLLKLQGNTSNISFAIGEIVRGVKQLAIKYQIPIVLVAHTKKLDVVEMPDINSIRDSSFIAQESDFAVILWRERKKMKHGTDIMDNEDIYTDRTILSLETNRRVGKSKKMALGFIDNVFYNTTDYYAFVRGEETVDRVSHMGDKNEELRKLDVSKNQESMFDNDIDVEEAFKDA